MKTYEIKKAVTQVFYEILYLQEKQKLLKEADTLYTNFYAKANLRLQKGESNILEKTTAETQKSGIAIQLFQVQLAIASSMLELQLLLNSNYKIEPTAIEYKMPNILISDSSTIANNPLLKIIEQQKNIAAAQTAVETEKLKPDFSLGYFNNSFKGTGADNKLYDGNTRFSAVQFGMGIPIFIKAQKARIAAGKIQENILQNQYQTEALNIQNQYEKILTAYNSNAKIVKQFEDYSLGNAALIMVTANKQFTNGEINYLDFVTLTNQAINIKSNYIEAIRALNESIISINFITAK